MELSKGHYAVTNNHQGGFENAITVDLAIGGSTNTILHLTALAHEAEIDFDVRLFAEMSKKSRTW